MGRAGLGGEVSMATENLTLFGRRRRGSVATGAARPGRMRRASRGFLVLGVLCGRRSGGARINWLLNAALGLEAGP